MIAPWDFLRDLMRPEYTYLAATLLLTLIATMVGVVSGSHVVTRGRDNAIDLFSCAVLPGVAVCLVFPGSPMWSTLVVLALTTLTVLAFRWACTLCHAERVRLGALTLAVTGTALVTIIQGWRNPGNMVSALLGSMRGADLRDVAVAATLALLTVLAVTFIHHHAVITGFRGRETGYPGWHSVAIDVVIAHAVGVAIVVAARPLGVTGAAVWLIVAPLVAWQFWKRVSSIMVGGVVLAFAASWVGVYVAWSASVPPGGPVVLSGLLLGALFVLAAPLRWLTGRFAVVRPLTPGQASPATTGRGGAVREPDRLLVHTGSHPTQSE